MIQLSENDKVDNAYEGVQPEPVNTVSSIDLNSITASVKRPVPSDQGKHLFGTWSD